MSESNPKYSIKTLFQAWIKFYLIVLCLILLSNHFIACKSIKNTNSVSHDYSAYQSILDSIYNSHPESIGIMAHIEAPEKGISWSGCKGYSESIHKVSLQPDQPALIASSIKTYISATILRLEEQGHLSIEHASKKYLSKKTIELFESDGYDMENIKIKHLLSHTSGIKDYADKEYLNWIDKNQKHRWTRDEQLELTIKKGDPLGAPEDLFSYADANFLLCTELIENVTKKPFYTSIRELLRYQELGFSDTWFPTLENKNPNTKSLVHQYWAEKNWDSYDHDISWDLYGGGGIATTTKELAQLSYQLFNGNIINDQNTFSKIYTKISTKDGEDVGYCLGLTEGETLGYKSYGHGGFWGTVVLYYPKLNTSISVYVLDRSEGKLRKNILEALVQELSKN